MQQSPAGFRCAILILAAVGTPVVCAADRVELAEDPALSRVVRTTVHVEVGGKLYTQPGPDKAIKLAVDARFEYDERRLPGTGREAGALRSLRDYESASASIEAGGQISNSTLRESLRLMVARGEPAGIDLYSPSGPMTYNELELLRTPADSLALVALLPADAVETGEAWKPADWVPPFLAGVEAAEKAALTCRLESVENGRARVSVTGEATGAVLGAPANVKLTGHFVFDLREKLIVECQMTQKELRSIGTVSPGIDVTAQAQWTREINASPRRLTDRTVAELPIDPNEANRLLVFDAAAWNARFFHDRHWHLFHQSTEAAILRLLDKGGLIAQCNIKTLPDAEPGAHVPEEQFQTDIQRTLGKNFQEIVQAEKVTLRDGLFVYRVIAVGTVDRRNEKNEPTVSPMQWIYYLVASEAGRQLAFVFTVDPRLEEHLKGRDLAIVGGLEFLPRRKSPAPAARRDR